MWPHDFIKERAEMGTQRLAKGVACPYICLQEMHTVDTGQISILSSQVRQVNRLFRQRKFSRVYSSTLC